MRSTPARQSGRLKENVSRNLVVDSREFRGLRAGVG
jgi:hypothetical protein